jgi:hypothetical protein
MHSITVWYIGTYREHQVTFFQPVTRFDPYMTADQTIEWARTRLVGTVTEVMAHDSRGRLVFHATPARVGATQSGDKGQGGMK